MNKKEKHLLLTLEYPPNCGGVGIYLKNLVGNNQTYDFKVIKHSEQNPCSLERASVSCENFFYNFFWPRWLKIYFSLKKLYKSWPFKVLHISHILPLGYVAYLLSKKLNISYVIYLHGLDFNLMKKSAWKARWGKKILARAKLVVTNSYFLKEAVQNFMGDDFNKIETIYPIPNQKLLAYQNNELVKNEALAFREKYAINKDNKILLTVGRLVERKGQALVLQALKYLPDYKYFILGRGPEKENLENLIKEYNLEDRVWLLSEILDDKTLAAYYEMADLFIMPSLELGADVEGFGIVYLEANAFALPVIAGQGQGILEAVADGETGLVLQKARDIDEIVMKIKKILGNQEYYNELQKNALKHYKKYLYEENHLFNKINKYL